MTSLKPLVIPSPPKIHWKEVESWQTRTRQYISTCAPEFLGQAEMLAGDEDLRHGVYPKVRSALSILRALRESPVGTQASSSTQLLSQPLRPVNESSSFTGTTTP
jgi:hypothetical protein